MEFEINHALFTHHVSIPVGTILPYIGSLTSLPKNWELCDGRLVNNGASPFNGKKLPLLTDDRFLMGVAAANSIGQPGGNNRIPQSGGHNHGGVTSGFGGYQQGEINYDRNQGHQDQFMMRFTISDDGQHDHSGENRPCFFGVYFIVRIY